MKHVFVLLILTSTLLAVTAQPNKKLVSANITTGDADSLFYAKTKYRLVGPFRGGRSAAVAGSFKNKNTFYF